MLLERNVSASNKVAGNRSATYRRRDANNGESLGRNRAHALPPFDPSSDWPATHSDSLLTNG